MKLTKEQAEWLIEKIKNQESKYNGGCSVCNARIGVSSILSIINQSTEKETLRDTEITELKPNGCPNCKDNGRVGVESYATNPRKGFRVSCVKCYAGQDSQYNSAQEAIETWNKRYDRA